MQYQINVNDTPEKKAFFVVVIIDDETKTSSSFALGKDEKHSTALKLIKSAIFKVQNKLWTPTKPTPKKPSKKSKSKPKSKKQ